MSNLAKEIENKGLEYFGRFYASYEGTVSSNEDPDNIGRLKLKVPDVYDGEHDYWAKPKGMFSGVGIGFYAIPNEGDNVWVSFQHGDPRFPLWEYGSWDKGQSPEGAKPNLKVLQTNKGHRVELDDDKDLIRIKHKSGHEIIVKSDGIFIGGSDESLHDILNDLMDLLIKAKTSTNLGAQPFINLPEFIKLKPRISKLLNAE